jgi:hypothetical protein
MPTRAAIRREQDKQHKHRVMVRLAVAAIIAAVIVGIGQIWFARQQTLNNRPNISVQASNPKPFASGEKMVLVVQVKNFGSTEAHDVTARSTLLTDLFKTDQEAFEFLPLMESGQPDTHAILAPGEAFQQNLISPHALKAEHYELVKNGTLKIYFFSEVSYTDTSGNKHGREVCQYYDPATALMTYCQTHNSSY